MTQTVNSAEEFVYRVCKHSFLSLWSYANPQGKEPSKELCDILIVCDPHVIIFSVKEIKVTNSGNPEIDWTRWRKRAIQESCKQIYGAERRIKSSTEVVKQDGTPGLMLPKTPCIHRVAVALGSQGKTPIEFGDFGKGFVHVFDEISFSFILSELDTISDFVDYLFDKEKLHSSGVRTVLAGGEEDLLALYLSNGRTFPFACSTLVIEDSLWKDFISGPHYRAKKRADADSYVWDNLIEILCRDILQGRLTSRGSLTDMETAMRVMARENRFNRRLLGQAFLEAIQSSGQKRIRSRMVQSHSDVTYVFLTAPHEVDRHFRQAELQNRCYIARGLNPNKHAVIGIATEQPETGQGFTLDLRYLYKEMWTDADQERLKTMQQNLGYFSNPVIQAIQEDEYPLAP